MMSNEFSRSAGLLVVRLKSWWRKPDNVGLAAWSLHRQGNASISAQGFGIRTGFVRLLHDALRTVAIDSREVSAQLHGQTVAALVILDQTHPRPHGGVLNRGAELPGRIVQCTVVTRRISARKQQLGIGAEFLGAFLHRISQRDVQ